MWGEHTQIGLDPHKSSSLFQHYCAQRNIGRFFAPLVGSRLSNSSFVEGMWRHAGVSASKFAKVFRKAAEINENMWNYNQGMWTDTGVSASKGIFKGIWKCSTPSLWPFPLWPSLTLMRKNVPVRSSFRPSFFHQLPGAHILKTDTEIKEKLQPSTKLPWLAESCYTTTSICPEPCSYFPVSAHNALLTLLTDISR